MKERENMVPNVSIASDSNNRNSEVMFNRDVLSRYNFCIDTLFVSKEGSVKFKESAIEGKDVKETILHISKNNTTTMLEFAEDWLIMFQEGFMGEEVVVSVYAKNYEIGGDILSKLKEYQLHVQENMVILTNLFYQDGEIKEDVKVLRSEHFSELNKDYYPYINTDIMFYDFTKSRENILMITGKPGIGKTKLINQYMKYLLDNIDIIEQDGVEDMYDISVLHVKSEALLASDKFWGYLAERKEIKLVILDDFDNFLAPRVIDVKTDLDFMKNNFISSFLSETDGTLKSDVKFIITTNRESDKMDPALIREGRTFDILQLRELKHNEALSIWEAEGFKKKDFEDIYSETKTITHASLGSEINKRKVSKGEKKKGYLLEEDISLLKKLTQSSTRETKIGLS